MRCIDTIIVRHQGVDRQVMLFVGDLANIPEHEAVDALIVSAFPDDYEPTPTSLIGSLSHAGVSVEQLSQDKEVDLRSFSCCWLSRPINIPGISFKRILCFEPGYQGKAAETVADIFRSIMPFTTGKTPISQIAMPLLASGDQGENDEIMLEVLTDAAVHWLSAGLPIERIKIVLRNPEKIASRSAVFARVKQRHLTSLTAAMSPPARFDVFLSYSQKNKDAVDRLADELLERRPTLRLFVDRLVLHPGAAWQQHIFDSIDQSRKVICALSPEYINSSICKEEFNIALLRHRESPDGVLLPLYLHTASLPTYMRLIHYEDAREGDHEKIAQAAENLLAHL